MILKENSKSIAVTALQRKLSNVLSIQLSADGHYGPATVRAVKQYQLKVGLVADGIAGIKTQQALQGECIKRCLKQSDIEDAARALGVDIPSVMAVNYVESNGSGFIDHRPAILFERHIMRRQLLKHGFGQEQVSQLQAQNPNLVNNATGGYQGGAHEHNRLAQAAKIHPQAAIESASWGMFQIMGFHWQYLGYASADDFKNAMSDSEGKQLDAFVRFIKADSKLHNALKEHKWAEFAKRYNGPAYAKNLYDVKLARAYQNFSELYAAQGQAHV